MLNKVDGDKGHTVTSRSQNEWGTPYAAASMRISTRGIHDSNEADLDSRQEESENIETNPELKWKILEKREEKRRGNGLPRCIVS